MQADLFGDLAPSADAPPQPAPPREPAPPERLRRKLGRILADLTPATYMPWNPSDETFWVSVFKGMAKELPREEAAEWRARLRAELARLHAAG